LAKPHLSSAYVSRHVSRDEIYQAFPPLFVLQATEAGRGGLGTRLLLSNVSQEVDHTRLCNEAKLQLKQPNLG